MFYFLELCSKLKLHGFKFAFDGRHMTVILSQYETFEAEIDLDNGLNTKLLFIGKDKGNFDFDSVDDFISWAKTISPVLDALE